MEEERKTIDYKCRRIRTMKQNDWLVASLNNPDFSPQDFKDVSGMTLDNTQFLSKDTYKKLPYIRNKQEFQNDEGQFSDEKFDSFYKNISDTFNTFSTEDSVDNYEYSIWDINRPTNSKVKDINFGINTVSNPDHIRIGIEGINQVSASDKSRRELAQNSKIYDPSTGQFLNKSVNDISLLSNPIAYVTSLFEDPLIYATYDEDTVEIDPITGNKVKHLKGEWKVNEDGEYYTEKSNGCNLRGKQVVSVEDYLTSENSAINKYDFMDSDDLEKSVAGTVAKNVAAIVPMLIPRVNSIYSGLLVGREIAKALPMAYGMISSLLGGEEDSQLANTIAAYGQKFTGSTSDYAQKKTFAFENFGNLMSDVALQWGQQKFIVNTFNKLKGGGEEAIKAATLNAQKKYADDAAKNLTAAGVAEPSGIVEMLATGKWTETALGKAALNTFLPSVQKTVQNRNRLAQDLSLIYMALISNTDVYDSIIEKGGTPEEAAAIAFGSAVGMFGVDKYLGLGEMFFQKDPAKIALRQAAKENAELYMAGRKVAADTNTKKGIIGAIQKGIGVGQKIVDDFGGKYKDGTLNIFGKAIGEGLEEVSEELVTDLTKNLGELAGKLGYFSQTDYGAWDSAGDRYAMSFLGGAAGGFMFGGVEAWNNRNNTTQQFQNEITYLLRQGKKKEILAELKKLQKTGKLGSDNISYITNSDGNITTLTADDERKSEAQTNYEGLANIIDQLDVILNNNQLNLSDDELFDKMVQGEYRANALADFLKGDNAENTKKISYISRYQEDFQQLSNDIINIEQKINDKINTTTDEQKREGTKFKEELAKLQQEKQQLIEQRDYLFGEGSLGYLEKTLFAMDTQLSRNFLALNINQYSRLATGKSLAELTPAELEAVTNAYKKSQNNSAKENLDKAFNLYKQMQKQLAPELQDLQNTDFSKELEALKKIRDTDPSKKLLNDGDKLDTETDEEYQSLAAPLENESIEDYNKRVKAHIDAVRKYNLDNQFKWIQEFAKSPITSTDFRYFVSKIGVLRNELLKLYLDNSWKNVDNSNLNEEDRSDFDSMNKDIYDLILKMGTQNPDALKKAIKNRIKEAVKLIINREVDNIDFVVNSYDIKNTLQNLTDEDKKNLGLKNYQFNPDVLTFRDLYIAGKKLGIDKEELLDILADESMSSDRSDVFSNFYDSVVVDPSNLDSEEANTIAGVSQGEYDKRIEQLVDLNYNSLEKSLDTFINNLNNTTQIKTLDALESASFVKNPVIPLLNKISSFTRKGVNVEQLLQEIYETYHNQETNTDFQLSDTQYADLKQILQDFQIAASFLYGASTQNNSPVGHNKSINDFVKNHKDVFSNFEELPEIASEDYNMLLGELAAYGREIQSWLNKHDTNTAQREVKFIKTDEALIKTVRKFFELNRTAFKITPTLDLLDGYDDLTLDDSLSSIVSLQELLHNNFIKSGLEIDEVLDKLSPVVFDRENAVYQGSMSLDENLAYNDMTDYDKFQLIVSACAASSVQYYQNLSTFLEANNSMAPISTQEYASKLVYSQQANPELINKALKWLGKDSKLDIAYNTSITLGIGGCGKTFAVARINVGTGKECWLSGPTQSQVDNLSQSLPDSEGKTKQDLLSIVFGGTVPTDIYTLVRENGMKITKLKDGLNIQKIDNPPKNLVIDEITHFSTPEIVAIAKFCEINHINLIALGDNHQNGFSNGDVGNVENNILLAWRTPAMYLSLRNGNVLKVANQQPLVNIIDKISIQDPSIFGNKVYNEEFKNIRLKYYNKDTFSGELIADTIDSDILAKIPKDASIGFIGDLSSSEYKKLVDAGFKVSDPISPLDVQGREFDYVVVDKKWELDVTSNNWNNNYINILEFTRDLYTMISRSTQGTILIDNGLSSIIGQSVSSESNGTYNGISKSVEKFRKKRISELSKTIEETKDLIIVQDKKEKKPDTVTIGGVTIGGVTIAATALEPEKKSSIDQDNKDGVKASNNDDNSTETNIPLDISVYSNFSYSGINTEGDEWVNENDSTTDLGIFIRKDQKNINKVEEMKKVLTLKSAIIYGGFDKDDSNFVYKNLPNYITDIIAEDAFKNIEYYIVIEDVANTNRLIGLTKGLGLENEKRAIKDKVVKVVAKLKGKDGKTYQVSLGALNNPETWEANKDKIKAAIKTKIDEGDSSKQEEYDKYDDTITSYKTWLNDRIGTNQEIRINKPQFSQYTRLMPLKGSYRLEDSVDTNAIYKSYVPLQVESPVHIVLGDIPGISKEMIGKPVMFVSSNFLLSPSDLKNVYLAQAKDPNIPKQVRMVRLDNVGVSFKSLYQNKWKELYNVTKGKTKFTTPMELQPFAIRMYKAMWNYRAGLERFLERYEAFCKENKLNDDDITKLCQDDNAEYYRLKGDKKEYSEAQYRKECDPEKAEKLEVLWKFNDSLADYVQQFRLGYESDHGVYLRKLTNINSKLHKKPDATVGIYINPAIARNQLDLIKGLFENIVDPIIGQSEQNTKSYITNTTNLEKGWFSKVEQTSDIQLQFEDDEVETQSTLHINDMTQLTTLPLIIIKAANYLNTANHMGKEEYGIFLAKNTTNDNVPYSITYKIPNKEEQTLNWYNILDALENQQGDQTDFDASKYPPGIIPLHKDGTGIQDSRLDDFWNLMFHGVVSTPVENDFTRDFIRASEAEFKYGIFSDPIAEINKKEDYDNVDLTLTSRKLFRVNAAAAGTMFKVSLSPYKESTTNQPVTNQPINNGTSTNTAIQELIKKIEPAISKLNIPNPNISNTKKYVDKVNTKIKGVLNSFITDTTNFKFEDIIVSIDYEGNVSYLKDKSEFAGKTLQTIKSLPNGKQLTFTDGSIYNIWYDNNELTIKQANPVVVEKQNYTKDEAIEKIEQLVRPFFEAIEDTEGFNELKNALRLKIGGDISSEDYNSIINNIVLKSINETYGDDETVEKEYNQLMENINNKNTCKL